MLKLHWIFAPLSVKLFLVYVVTAVALTIVRALRLISRFFAVRARQVSWEDLRSGTVSPESFGKAALANRVRYDVAPRSPAQPQDPDSGDTNKRPNTPSDKVVLRALKKADGAFRLAAQACEIKIASIRRLLWLTVLLSVLLITFDAYTVWLSLWENSKITGLTALLEAVPILLDWLSFSLAGCAVLYATSSFLEGVLQRRQARWQYFYSQTTADLSG